MKKLSIALVFLAASAGAQKPIPDPAFAKLPGQGLRVADSVVLDLKSRKIEPPLTLFAGPKGGIVVYSQWREVTAFDSSGRRIWSQGGSGQERGEIAEVTAFGWQNGEMWASDAAFRQIALLDQYGNVTKSIELPSWVRPTFSNRKAFPVFESMRVFARYPDGSMLVMPRGSMSITGATDYDPKSNYLLRINEDGIIQKTIARFPSNVVNSTDARGRKFTFQNPLHQWFSRATSDGTRIMVVSVDTSAKQTDTVVVRALGEKGDTLWVQKFAYPALVYTAAQIDSIGRLRWGNDTDYREARANLLPRRAPTIADVALDPDKAVWITLRGNNSTRPAVGFDPTGKPIGKLLLPARRSVKAANAGGVWVSEARADQRGEVVRYRVK